MQGCWAFLSLREREANQPGALDYKMQSTLASTEYRALMVRIGLWGPLYYNYLRPYTNCWRSGGRNRCSYICCICWHMYCILLADNLIYEILLLVVVVVVGGGAIAFTVDI